MKSILLVVEDPKEAEFIEKSLLESGVSVICAKGLAEAALLFGAVIPDLIVINTSDSDASINSFYKKVKGSLPHVTILSMPDLGDHAQLAGKDHLRVRPLRPKLFLSLIRGIINGEETSWLPELQPQH